MKVILLSSTDNAGGAARATYRLFEELQLLDLNCRMIVKKKFSHNNGVTVAFPGLIERALAVITPRIEGVISSHMNPKRDPAIWTLNRIPNRLHKRVSEARPDVVNLHWVAGGFVPVCALHQFRCPLVWTLHDMWPFTGGCHYDRECGKYTDNCGACPQLRSDRQTDLSRWLLKHKSTSWQSSNLTIVTPSRWLSDCAKSSRLFRNRRVETIPNGLDLKTFRPIAKHSARQILGVEEEKLIILFGAMNSTADRRKGFQHLTAALKELAAHRLAKSFHAVVFGSTDSAYQDDFGLPATYFGNLHDDVSLALLYSAADVFVAPSEQDNFPNTVLESLACGTPVVAFSIGGMPDLVEHKSTGYLARPFESRDLAHGIAWTLSDEDRLRRMSEGARHKAEQEFSNTLQAERYNSLYRELADSAPRLSSEAT